MSSYENDLHMTSGSDSFTDEEDYTFNKSSKTSSTPVVLYSALLAGFVTLVTAIGGVVYYNSNQNAVQATGAAPNKAGAGPVSARGRGAADGVNKNLSTAAPQALADGHGPKIVKKENEITKAAQGKDSKQLKAATGEADKENAGQQVTTSGKKRVLQVLGGAAAALFTAKVAHSAFTGGASAPSAGDAGTAAIVGTTDTSAPVTATSVGGDAAVTAPAGWSTTKKVGGTIAAIVSGDALWEGVGKQPGLVHLGRKANELRKWMQPGDRPESGDDAAEQTRGGERQALSQVGGGGDGSGQPDASQRVSRRRREAATADSTTEDRAARIGATPGPSSAGVMDAPRRRLTAAGAADAFQGPASGLATVPASAQVGGQEGAPAAAPSKVSTVLGYLNPRNWRSESGAVAATQPALSQPGATPPHGGASAGGAAAGVQLEHTSGRQSGSGEAETHRATAAAVADLAEARLAAQVQPQGSASSSADPTSVPTPRIVVPEAQTAAQPPTGDSAEELAIRALAATDAINALASAQPPTGETNPEVAASEVAGDGAAKPTVDPVQEEALAAARLAEEARLAKEVGAQAEEARVETQVTASNEEAAASELGPVVAGEVAEAGEPQLEQVHTDVAADGSGTPAQTVVKGAKNAETAEVDAAQSAPQVEAAANAGAATDVNGEDAHTPEATPGQDRASHDDEERQESEETTHEQAAAQAEQTRLPEEAQEKKGEDPQAPTLTAPVAAADTGADGETDLTSGPAADGAAPQEGDAAVDASATPVREGDDVKETEPDAAPVVDEQAAAETARVAADAAEVARAAEHPGAEGEDTEAGQRQEDQPIAPEVAPGAEGGAEEEVGAAAAATAAEADRVAATDANAAVVSDGQTQVDGEATGAVCAGGQDAQALADADAATGAEEEAGANTQRGDAPNGGDAEEPAPVATEVAAAPTENDDSTPKSEEERAAADAERLAADDQNVEEQEKEKMNGDADAAIEHEEAATGADAALDAAAAEVPEKAATGADAAAEDVEDNSQKQADEAAAAEVDAEKLDADGDNSRDVEGEEADRDAEEPAEADAAALTATTQAAAAHQEQESNDLVAERDATEAEGSQAGGEEVEEERLGADIPEEETPAAEALTAGLSPAAPIDSSEHDELLEIRRYNCSFSFTKSRKNFRVKINGKKVTVKGKDLFPWDRSQDVVESFLKEHLMFKTRDECYRVVETEAEQILGHLEELDAETDSCDFKEVKFQKVYEE